QSHTAAGDHTAPAVHGDSHTKAGVVRCNGHAIAGIQCNGHPVAAAIQCNGHPTAGIQCNGHPTAAEVEPGVKLSSATGDAQLHPPVVGLPSVHSLLSPPTGPEGTAK
ncbi:MAG: hypothetical protein HOV71_28575, partial [Hamadaea sp.]|nr:hypothetical protein [Hamadaea sp.]